jgi:di/tricarboxylate transporter
MILAGSFELVSMFKAASFAAVAMLVARCCTVDSVRRSIDWSVLLAIGGSIGLSRALELTKLADAFASGAVGMTGGSPWLALAAVYLVTLIATELITNTAAAALMFPLAMSTAARLDVHPMAFVVAVMMAASAGFATPIGYQTNLMVWGPGNYRFSDYLRIGIPLDLLVMAVTVLLAPWIWPF